MAPMSVVDITLPHDMFGFGSGDGRLIWKVEALLRDYSKHTQRLDQMHLIRTFTPEHNCMVLSLSKGPGHEKIFEIFVSADDEPDADFEVLVLVHKEYCPKLYALLEVDPSEPYAQILFRELVDPDEPGMPEFLFCNWSPIQTGVAKDMASICFGTDDWEDYLHFGALVVGIVKCLMDLDLSDDEDDEDEYDGQGRFQFLRSSAEH